MSISPNIYYVVNQCYLVPFAFDFINFICRFASYNFKADSDFIHGWQQLIQSADSSIDDNTIALRFLSAKIFYFTKYV